MHGRLEQERGHALVAQQRLAAAVRSRVDSASRTLERTGMRLELIDPKLVLKRGYALLRDAQGVPLTSARQTHPGQAVTATLVDGEVDATVRAVRAGG
jgi:exodeoxyribonuclease VII large subunit